MPRKVDCPMAKRADLAQEMLAHREPVATIAAKYDLSRTAAYKWKRRFLEHGRDGMQDQSRRPQHSPNQTAQRVELAVCQRRERHPTWGPEKIHHLLAQEGLPGLPSLRTVGRILQRQGLTRPHPPAQTEYRRFQWKGPNELWQLDFKARIYLSLNPLLRAFPMTLEDDYSRFALSLTANADHRFPGLWQVLWDTMGEYGMPGVILTDNDTVFRGHRGGLTQFTAHLLRLGIRHLSGRPYHPQTQGKVERLHGTIQSDVLQGRQFGSLQELQAAFDDFPDLYNHLRPHQALDLQVPAQRYQPGSRPRPQALPPVEYPAGAELRKVWESGCLQVRGCRLHIGEGIAGQRVRLHDRDPLLAVEYAGHILRQIRWDELRKGEWV